MKYNLLILTLSVLTVSCSRYQYVTISSENARINESQELVMENDSFSITYNFYGADAPMHMVVQNKLNKPVYIDWKRSSLIINGQASSYMPGTMNISGSTSGTSVALTRGMSMHSGSFSATAALPEDWQWLPPKTHTTKAAGSVLPGFFNQLPDSQFMRMKIPLNDGHNHWVKEAKFTPDNTPYRFKSFLTFQIGEPGAQQMVYYEHEFYISALWQTGSSPSTIMLGRDKQGNRAYLQKITGGAAVVAGVVVGAAVLAVAIAESNPEPASREN